MHNTTGAPDRAPGEGPLEEVVLASRDLALIWLSPDGVITAWRAAAERLFGYGSDEVVGRPFSMLFTPVDQAHGIDRFEVELANRTGRSEDDRWHLRKDGTRFWANGLLLRWQDGDGRLLGYAKFLRDRTDARIRDEALGQRVDALAREVAQREEGLLTLLHEARNPLAAIANVAKVLAATPAEAVRQRMVDALVRQTQVLERLVLDAASATKGSSERLELSSLTLQGALQIAVDGLRETATGKQLALQLVVPDTPVVVQADAGMLQRILHNLIANALKYTPAGGHVVVSGATEAEEAVIRVEDDGVGIAPENLARIFELFTREDSESAVVEGFGIGLAVARELAALHGGFIEARSPGKGKGSQFKLRLPLIPPDHGRHRNGCAD